MHRPRARLRIHIRGYCYGCRRRLGRRWHQTFATSAVLHRWSWEYTIRLGGHQLMRKQSFGTWQRAWDSAQRAYRRLAADLPREVCGLTTTRTEPPS